MKINNNFHVKIVIVFLFVCLFVVFFFGSKINCGLKDTDFCLLACGGHPLSPPINSPDNIAHIKGITYLSDYGVIMVCLGGVKKRAIRY